MTKPRNQYIVNPLTGRRIRANGPTGRRLRAAHQQITTLLRTQRGGQLPIDPSRLASERERFYDTLTGRYNPAMYQVLPGTDPDHVLIPPDLQGLMSSALPPNPPYPGASYYGHKAPLYQNFGDYVCVRRDTLSEFGRLLGTALGSSVRLDATKR